MHQSIRCTRRCFSENSPRTIYELLQLPGQGVVLGEVLRVGGDPGAEDIEDAQADGGLRVLHPLPCLLWREARRRFDAVPPQEEVQQHVRRREGPVRQQLCMRSEEQAAQQRRQTLE